MEVACKQSQSYQDKIVKQLESMPDIPTRIFSDFDKAQVRKYYVRKGSIALAKALNKRPDQIVRLANGLGLKRRGV